MKFFKHETALVESETIGANTRIWAFTHVLPGAQIGSDCNICDHVFVENDVVIGNRVTIKSGVQVWDGVRLEDDSFIGPNATFTNDLFPRSKKYPEKFTPTIVRKGASIGANATILAGVTLGANSMVGAGAVVTRDVPPNAIVVGNPAIIKGYASPDAGGMLKAENLKNNDDRFYPIRPSKVNGVQLYRMPTFTDLRGSLSVGELDSSFPFPVKRYFLVFDVPSREIRGEHAHKKLHQFLCCVKGNCSVVVDDGANREEFVLDSPGLGIHIPPMIWGVQYKYSENAVLMVLASDHYDSDDYIRDYEGFLKLVRSNMA